MKLQDMTRDELRKLAKELDIAGRGTMLKPELVAAIEAADNAMQRALEPSEPVAAIGGKRNAEKIDGMAREMARAAIEYRVMREPLVQKRLNKITRKQREKYGRTGERGKVGGEIMPLHHGGRAMGAKHLNPRVVGKAGTR